MTTGTKKSEMKTIKTEDLDVEQAKETQREHAIPGQIKRDAPIAGGKQVIHNLVIAVNVLHNDSMDYCRLFDW